MKKQRSAFLRLLRYTRPSVLLLVLSLLLTALQTAATLLGPVFIGRAIDYIVDVNNVDFLKILYYAGLLGITTAVAVVTQYLASHFIAVVAHRTVKALRIEAYNKLYDVPVSYIDGHSHGDLLARIVTDIDMISDGLIQGISQIFAGILTIAGTLIFMLRINPFITAAVVVMTPLSLFVAYFIAKGSHNMFKAQARHRGQLTGHINEMLGNQRIVKLFGKEAYSAAEFNRINGELKVSSQKAAFYAAAVNPTTRFINALIYIVVCVLGVLLVTGFSGLAFAGAISVGALSSLLLYANQYTKPFNEITGVIAEFQTSLAGACRVFSLLDEPEILSDADMGALDLHGGTVNINNVDFSYIPEKPLIRGLSLEVDAGKRVALVGPTGCGKTTVINLLLRFYDAQSGSIEIDGQNIAQVTRKSLRRAYGMVLQDTWLKRGTIAENIGYGKPDATREEIIAAAKAARVDGFIEQLSNGYDTVLDENGGNLSEGQKQLLSISRVMLLKPDMLILDEATSSIDLRTEILVQQAFETLMKGKTSFIVAHRLSTIQTADIILVMQNGIVIEQGSHDELLEKQGFYYELYQAQFS